MHHYLSIIRWPEGTDRAAAADLLVREAGFDLPTAQLRAGMPPPFVWGRTDRTRADAAIACLRARGGDAFAPTRAEIEALGESRKIRDMRLTPRGLALDVWRGEPVTIDPAAIEVIVRGKMSETLGLGPGAAPTPGTAAIGDILRMPMGGAAFMAWGAGGSYGWAIGIHAAAEFRDMSARDRRITTSHKLDLHASDGRVYQVDGDKFGFEILGAERGHSDNVNIDRMCELFVRLAPNAVVDVYFELFRPPAGADRLRLPKMQINNDDPYFAFYSRWSALLYRHVMAG